MVYSISIILLITFSGGCAAPNKAPGDGESHDTPQPEKAPYTATTDSTPQFDTAVPALQPTQTEAQSIKPPQITLPPTLTIEALPAVPEKGLEMDEKEYIDNLTIILMESFPVQAEALITGNLPDSCTTIKDISVTFQADNLFIIRIFTERPPDAMCAQALVPFEESIKLDISGLPAGEYTVQAYDKIATFRLETDNTLPDGD